MGQLLLLNWAYSRQKYSDIPLVSMRTNLIIITKSEVRILHHCLGLVHETMVPAACLTMFFGKWILIEKHVVNYPKGVNFLPIFRIVSVPQISSAYPVFQLY